MKNPLFRIWDAQNAKYYGSSEIFIGLDGSLYAISNKDEKLQQIPPADRNTALFTDEICYTIGIKDINGNEAYSDDHIVMLYDNQMVQGFLAFVERKRAWNVVLNGSFELEIPAEFELLPNREEREKGNEALGAIMRKWEEKSKEIPSLPAPVIMWTPDEPKEQTIIEESQDVVAPATAKKVSSWSAEKLQNIITEDAPIYWRKIAAIAEARPKQSGVQIALARLTDTNIAQWFICRNEKWAAASDMFMVTEHIKEEPTQEEETADENTTAQ